jgi:hypothetical protein
MYMLDGYFHLHHVKPIFLADLPNQLYRSFLNLFSLKDLQLIQAHSRGEVRPADFQLMSNLCELPHCLNSEFFMHLLHLRYINTGNPKDLIKEVFGVLNKGHDAPE